MLSEQQEVGGIAAVGCRGVEVPGSGSSQRLEEKVWDANRSPQPDNQAKPNSVLLFRPRVLQICLNLVLHSQGCCHRQGWGLGQPTPATAASQSRLKGKRDTLKRTEANTDSETNRNEPLV